MKIVADVNSTKQALLSFHSKFELVQKLTHDFFTKNQQAKAKMTEQLTQAIKDALDQKKKETKKKHHKGDKGKDLKKWKSYEQEEFAAKIELVAKMMYRIYNARKVVIFRTLAILKLQHKLQQVVDNKHTPPGDREAWLKQTVAQIKSLERKTEQLKNEINHICDVLQLTVEKKKESMDTYN